MIPTGLFLKKIGNYLYKDSINLVNKTYTNVYHVYTDSALLEKDVIVTAGIFYTVKHGLIAFYLSNGETWALQ